jgi:signal transduction histidine kinase
MHLGLASMRERVRLVHGTLDIESAPGQGTTVLAWVPADEAPQ